MNLADKHNAAAMREALERCRNTLIGVRDLTTNPDIRNGVANCLLEYIEPALADPPRNCDVGTAEEQDKRFTYQFCRVGIEGCIRCKLNTLKHRGNTCGIHWAQMPYEKGDAK